MNTLVIPSHLANELRTLFDNAPLESAGVLFCHEARGAQGVKLLASDFSPYAANEYVECARDKIVIAPVAVNERIQRAREAGLSIVQVHTHPMDQHAQFSKADLDGEGHTIPVMSRRVPHRFHGTLVLGTSSSSARFYDAQLAISQARVIVVGRSIERLDPPILGEQERFARSYLAIGKAGQAALQDMHFGIVGLGGLGSLVAEQLAYLGARRLVMVDPDVIEESNLNRVVGAICSDIGRSKVYVAAERYKAVLPSASIETVLGSVLDESVARTLIDCDLVFCCTDGHGSRALLNWLAYQYLIPTIDAGVEIAVDSDRVRAIAGRTQLLGPGMPCLHCCENLDANRVREEFMTEDERARDEYVVGARLAQPAVVTFNGVIASLATSMLVGVATTLPLRARMQTFNALTGQVRSAESSPKEGCPICSAQSTIIGLGDSLDAIWRKAG